MRQSGFIFIIFSIVFFSYSQNNIGYDIERGIDIVEQQYVDAWKKIKKMEGFRIQVTSFSGVNSRTSIEYTTAQFKQLFPDIPCEITFSEPNFRLRVGNYSTKLEAYKALHKIAAQFPGAFVLRDQIDFKSNY